MKRPASTVIDEAIRENRYAEIVLYGLATIVVLAGSFTLVYAVVTGQPIPAVAGAASDSLFIPAMVFAARVRKANMAIRLLEVPLSKAETAEEAAKAIMDFFLSANAQQAGLGLFSKHGG